jgi:aspartyl-tRNA(Asn)/glutamyl-tRNA(Gln) amidotransferase subunit B
LRPKGQQEFGTRTEIKNVNSFRFVEQAINVEIERQRDILEDGGTIIQETRLFDANKMETRSMRSKEVENDYRYFPCPDLLPIVIDDDYIEAIRKTLPELPDQKKQRLMSEQGLSEYDAAILTATRELAVYFEQVAEKCGDYKLAANWVMGELSAALNKSEADIKTCPISAENLGAMIVRIKDNTISGKGAKSVFQNLWDQTGDDVDALIDSLGLKQVSDSGAIEGIVDDVLNANQAQVDQYVNAEPDKRGKMVGFFVGQVMKASKGSANPGMVNKVLKEKLDARC